MKYYHGKWSIITENEVLSQRWDVRSWVNQELKSYSTLSLSKKNIKFKVQLGLF